MSITLIILLVITVFFLLGFMYIEPILMKHKVKNDNEYGSARFSSDKEIKQNFKKEKINNIIEEISKLIAFANQNLHKSDLLSYSNNKDFSKELLTIINNGKLDKDYGINNNILLCFNILDNYFCK